MIWRKSTASGAGSCVEVASTGTCILVRDSKDRSSAPLEFIPAEWQEFLEGVRSGLFDYDALSGPPDPKESRSRWTEFAVGTVEIAAELTVVLEPVIIGSGHLPVVVAAGTVAAMARAAGLWISSRRRT